MDKNQDEFIEQGNIDEIISRARKLGYGEEQLNKIDKYHEKFMDLIKKKASSLNDVMRELSKEERELVSKIGLSSYVTSVVANFASHQYIKLYKIDKNASSKLKEGIRLSFRAVKENMQKILNNEPVNLTVVKKRK